MNIDCLGDNKETPKIGTARHTTGKGYKWRYKLAEIIARNFRCKVYLINGIDVVFYGYESDSKAALSTFSFLFKVGNKLAAKVEEAFTEKMKGCKVKSSTLTVSSNRNVYLDGQRDGKNMAESRNLPA